METEYEEDAIENEDGDYQVVYSGENIRNRQAQEEPEKKQRVKLWMGWALCITALTIDLLEMLFTYLGIGVVLCEVTAPATAFVFWLWFQLLDVSYTSNTKKFAISVVVFLGELIPGFDAVPFLAFGWTIGMILIVLLTRMEDRGEKPSIFAALNEVMLISNAPMTAGVSLLALKGQRTMRQRSARKEREKRREQELEEEKFNPENILDLKSAENQEAAERFRNPELERKAAEKIGQDAQHRFQHGPRGK